MTENILNTCANNSTTYQIGKLVRDKILDINKDQQIKYTTKKINSIKIAILRKLIEEISELKKEIYGLEYRPYSIYEEMVDCFEVLMNALQAWNNVYRGYSLNQLKAAILQNIDESKINLKAGEISREMYTIALQALTINNNDAAKVIELLNQLCEYISLLMFKLNISFDIILSLGDKKRQHRGGFEKKIFLLKMEVPNDHALKAVYDKKYSKNNFKKKSLTPAVEISDE